MQVAPIINRPAPLSSVIMSLSWKESLDLFKRLNGGGTVGFDYGQYRLADLRNILSAWIAQGVPADVVDLHARAIVGARAGKQTVLPPAPATIIAAPAAPQPGVVTLPSGPVIQPLTPTETIQAAHNVLPPDPMSVRESLAEAIAEAQRITAQTHPATVQAGLVPPLPLQGVTGGEAMPSPIVIDAPADAQPFDAQPAPVQAPAVIVPPPAGRAYARDVFADLPRAIVDAISPTLTIPVFQNPEAEPLDRDAYTFQAATLVPTLIAMAQTPTQRIWLGGPQSTGKTEFVRALAQRTGRALFRVNFNKFSEASDIIGDQGLTNGNTHFAPGPVTLACQYTDGSAMVLLDEPTYSGAGAIACLNPLLEEHGAAVRLPRSGKVLPVPPLMQWIAADNTFGAGNDSGEYEGRQTLGADFRSRFKLKLKFDYLPEAAERDLLRRMIEKSTGRKPALAAMKPIMALLKTCRVKSDAGELQGAPGYRGAAAFAIMLAYGCKPADAWTNTVVLGAPEASHEALRLVFTSVWPVDSTGNLATFQGEI